VLRTLVSHGPHEIRQHAVGGGVEAGISLEDGEDWEGVGIEADIGGGSRCPAHGRANHDLLRPDACFDSTSLSLRPAYELIGKPVHSGLAKDLWPQVADAFAGDFFEANRNIHQDGDERGGFYGGVPAVDVVRGVGLGYAEGLRFLQRLVEGEALFHLAEDYVRGGIQDAVESVQVDRGHLIEQREDGDAIHHGGFEEEALALGGGEVAEVAVGVDDWSFVGGDGVGSVVEGGADVICGGLAGLDVEGGGFEEDVGLGGGQPVLDVCWLRIRSSGFSARGRALYIIHTELGSQTVRVGDPSQAAGCEARDAEGNSVALE
jgi:hypothetical protein